MSHLERSPSLGNPALGLVLTLVLGGCAFTAPQTDRLLTEWNSVTKAKAEITTVPFFPDDKFYCGPASLAMVLNWTGDRVSRDALVPMVYTPGRKGTLQSEIITAARRRGRLAYPVSTLKELLREVSSGHPVIVLQNLGLSWYPKWHYAVVVGYDLAEKNVILHSGVEKETPMPLRLFELTWARGDHWAVVVLPPGTLPESAVERNYLNAVVGLERAGQWEAAASAYQAALKRWPSSLAALIGLGNSRYEMRDLAGAEKAFLEAIHIHPTAAPAYNNLAQVLADTGRRREALLHVERAIMLGGPMKPFFLKTREKIQENGGTWQDEDLPVLEKHM